MTDSLVEREPIILRPSAAEHFEQDCACAENPPSPKILRQHPEGSIAATDCACPGEAATLVSHRLGVPGLRWQKASGLYRDSLVRDYAVYFGPGGVSVLNGPAERLLDAFALPRRLEDALQATPTLPPATTGQAIGHLVESGLLVQGEATPCPIWPAPETLVVWLHVTNACNLQCTYCYLPHGDTTAMDEGTGREAVDMALRVAARHGFRAVKLKYAGGEPTLNFGLVRALHEYARRQTVSHGLGLHETVLSNGVALSDSILGFVRDAGMRLMVSLDGVGPAHGGQRSLAGGRPSSRLVAEGVDRALARGVEPYLSITVTQRNAAGVAEVVEFALERNLPFNLNFYREHVEKPSGSSLRAEDARLIAGIQDAFAAIERRLPVRRSLLSVLDRANFSVPHRHTCGAGRNYLVVGPQGQVARCQMEIEQAVSTIQADDPLEAVRRSGQGFCNPPVDARGTCRECAWRYGCAGGCPLLAHRVRGRSDVPSPYCNVYQALYPDLLRLEGLRLLKGGSSQD